MRTTVSVNMDFTTEDLTKFCEDQGRRFIVNGLSSLFHFANCHFDPEVVKTIVGVAQSAFQNGLRRQGIGDQPSHPQAGGCTGGPVCFTLEETPLHDASWVCHECGTHNGQHRGQCRKCGHDRCGTGGAPGASPAPDNSAALGDEPDPEAQPVPGRTNRFA